VTLQVVSYPLSVGEERRNTVRHIQGCLRAGLAGLPWSNPPGRYRVLAGPAGKRWRKLRTCLSIQVGTVTPGTARDNREKSDVFISYLLVI